MNFKKKTTFKNRKINLVTRFVVKFDTYFSLFTITFDRKITLMQCLRHYNRDFKLFLMIYYMPDFDNRARNDVRLIFACAKIG